MSSFADLGVPAEIVDALERRGFTTPFAIQATTIPDALDGLDVCGRAPTGSGKTIAFGVPMLADIGRAAPRRPLGLILAPTRELADQIRRELAPLAAACRRRVVAVYGGVGYGPQVQALREGVDVLVACPGRLADLIGQQAVSLQDVDCVVIDEADRMADMGFLPEVRRLLNQTPTDRQTLLFSATLDGDVAVLIREYQHQPVHHEAGEAGPDIHAARHLFWRVEQPDRVRVAAEVIAARGATIVFCRTRHRADRVARQLNRAGASAAAIHGGRNQGQRTRALEAFTNGTAGALVATDVAARGIHVDGVACVIHFDLPGDEKTYVHRSGRTARAGATGVVVAFVGEEQLDELEAMQRALGLPRGVAAPALPALDGGATPLEPAGPAPARRRRRRKPPGTAEPEAAGAPRKSRAPRKPRPLATVRDAG